METIKVFELAKQMGIETIALMDKLREFKIPVKSHMAELEPTLIEQIQAKFAEEKSKASPKGAKSTRTRKAAAPKAATPATPKVVKASTAKAAPAKPPVILKGPAKVAAAAAAAAAAAPASAKANSRTVIRRKANTLEAESAPEAPEVLETETLTSVDMDAEEVSSGEMEPVETAAAAQAEPARPAVTVLPRPTSKPGDAQVISRIDLRETMGDRSPKKPLNTEAASARPASPQTVDEDKQKFDREAIGKLIKQEALAQARKAAALQRETQVEVFNVSEFKKREMLFSPKKKKTLVGRSAQKTQITTPSAQKRKIKIEGAISVSGLAKEMGVKTNELLKKLIAMGTVVTINSVLDFETAHLMGEEYNYEIENILKSDAELIRHDFEKADDKGELVHRPPVVTVMGHVDHGKTSLLDVIRQANVAKGEAGGITQHIGAYSVEVNGKKITFLDTPGHEAFTAMRARGAKVTDIVILVVAADDGIMPQTREAIIHAKSAGVPIIVAINKMDLPGANPQKVLQGLTEFELVPEEWGGTTLVAKVSAAKKEGIKELLEQVLLQAEVLELKANPKRPATGNVVEARLERGRGTVATLLVAQGTAHVGEMLVAGTAFGRIRAMLDDKGKNIKEAGPGQPIEVLGLNLVPGAGDTFDIVKDEEVAKEVVEKRIQKIRQSLQTVPSAKMSLEELFSKVKTDDLKELSVVVKADVHGSAEALKEMLNKLPTDQVKVKVLSSAVGGITESDVLLASASKALIIGFNVRPENGVLAIAQREGVEIKTYAVIYDIIDDIKKAMTGKLAPTFVEKAMGRAEIRSLFSVPKIGMVAGCMVIDGRITRQAQIRLLRESRIVYEGKLASLKRFKDDVKEVQNGFECGLGIENYNDLKVGDVVEAFTKEQVAGLLS